MDEKGLRKLLEEFKKGKLSLDDIAELFSAGGFTDIGYAKVDTSRFLRIGFPEVIFCSGKKVTDIVKITEQLFKKNGMALLTRVQDEHYNALQSYHKNITYYKDARIIFIGDKPEARGLISVLSGGTSDIPIAEEAAVTAELFGCIVKRFYDVGIAGIHRLFSYREEIGKSNAIVAVAGMEGALPSVVGGLFSVPIIGVPTSVGYGASLGGIAPLLTMLNSCSPGVAVVNIDNGFGAGYIASTINRLIVKAHKHE